MQNAVMQTARRLLVCRVPVFPGHGLLPLQTLFRSIVGFYGNGYPDSKTGTGDNNRYQPLGQNGILLYLTDTLQKCRRYVLEFDAMRVFNGTSPYAYPSSDALHVAFSNSAFVTDPVGTFKIRTLPSYSIPTISRTAWEHFKFTFSYCADTAANVLYLDIDGAFVNNEILPTTLLDNVSVTEQDMDISIAITDTATGGFCNHVLSAGPPSNGCPSMTYTWKDATGATVGTSRTINVAPMDTANYTVTVSDGCNSAADTVTVLPCACSPVKVFSSKIYTPLSGTYSGSASSGFYYVTSNLTITGSSSFTGANMLVAPDVTITVNNGVKLDLDNSHLFTCPIAPVMWNGIKLVGGTNSGKIELSNNTLIEDADTAINASDPDVSGSDVIKSHNATFNRNQTGIAIDNVYASSPATYPFSISNTVFTSRDLSTVAGYPVTWTATAGLRSFYDVDSSYVPPVKIDTGYVMQDLKSGGIACAGIRLNNVGDTTGTNFAGIVIGDGTDSTYRNLFDNTGDGIYALNSNLSSYNNLFIRFRRNFIVAGGPLPIPLGAGINARVYPANAAKSRLLLLKLPPGINYEKDNEFFNCYIAVSATDYWNVHCDQSWMQTDNTASSAGYVGYNISSKRYDSIVLVNNFIYNVAKGIAINSNSGTSGYKQGAVTVYRNEMNANAPKLRKDTRHFIRQAISVSGSLLSYKRGGDIHIGRNILWNVYNGILVSNMTAQRAYTDSVNDITMISDPASATQYGINYTNSTYGIVQHNVVATLASGGANHDKARAYYFAGNTNTLVQCNVDSNTGRGFDFTGTQHNTHWQGNSMEGNSTGFSIGGPIDKQGTTSQPSYNEWVGTWSPGLQQQTLTYNATPSATSRLTVRPFPTEEPTINNATPFGYRYDGGLGTILTSVMGSDPCTASPVINPMTKSPGSVANFLVASKPLFGSDEAVKNWIGQFGIWQVISVDTVLDDSLAQAMAAFKTVAAGTRYEWLTAIEMALSEGDTATAATLLASPVAAAGRMEYDSTLIITDTANADGIVLNYTGFYSIYLNYLKGNIIDTAGLFLLANKCPLTEGSVVYQARVLYSMVYGADNIYDDDSLCAGPGGLRTIMDLRPGQHYSLYPNPNNGDMTLQQLIPDEDPVQVRIYDLLGKLVLSSSLQFGKGITSLHTGDVASGLYLLQLSDHKGVTLL